MRYSSADITTSIPRSRMEWPDTFGDWLKFLFWKAYTPFHPLARDTSLALGIVRHEGRQRFLLGTFHPERSPDAFVQHLIDAGYRNNFIAWKDDGEIFGVRKTVGFTHQYHIRLFEDGEIRAHYEYTPEYRPAQHLDEIGIEERREEFMGVVREWLASSAD